MIGSPWKENGPDGGYEAAPRRRVQGEGGARGAEGGADGRASLVAKHGVHQTLINTWKRQATEGMASASRPRWSAPRPDGRAELDRLHAKIGQLVVERDSSREGERAPVIDPSGPANDDEPRPEARDDGAGASAAVDPAAVPAPLDWSVGLTHGPVHDESPLILAFAIAAWTNGATRLVAADRRAVPQDARYGAHQMARQAKSGGPERWVLRLVRLPLSLEDGARAGDGPWPPLTSSSSSGATLEPA